ncbi:MAG: RNA 2',3'-cyclic phosphodiesterase [Candidatus Caldatribacteriaceae bacterium]
MEREETVRSFIALDLDPKVKDFLEDLINRWKKRCPQAKWVRKEQLHITLAFFPALPVRHIGNIEQLLGELGNGFPSFKMELSKTGTFPSWNRVRVLWVGFDEEGEEQVKQIGKTLIQGLYAARVPIEEERELTPHVTLARLRAPVALSASDWKLENPPVSLIQRIALFQSILTPQGPIYKELSVSHLKG